MKTAIQTLEALATLAGYEYHDPRGKTVTRKIDCWVDELPILDKSGLLLKCGERFSPHLDSPGGPYHRQKILRALPPSVAYCFSNNKLYDVRNSIARGTDEFWDIYGSDETDPHSAFCDILYQWIENQKQA